MNNLGLCMIWTTQGYVLRALDAMNNLGLWMIWTTLGHELNDLVA